MRNGIKKVKNSRLLPFILGGIIAIILIVLTGYIVFTSGKVQIDDSLIQAPLITITPSSAGTLNELDAYEGESVKKGDTLAVVGTNVIRSATDGLIVSASNQTGGTVGPTTQLIQMIDPAQLRVAGTIDENKGLSQIKIGQVASFTVDALPGQIFWGYVDEISPSAKQTALSFSISTERPTQQFVVYVGYNAAKYPQIKNGMSAKITVYTKTN